MRTHDQTEPSPRAYNPPAPPAGEDFSICSKSLQESFQVWLRGVTGGARVRPPARALTPAEAAAVGVVTVREGCKHRRWPREVVERFSAAEVLTRPTGRESNTPARRLNFLRMPGEGYAKIANLLRR